MKRDHRSSCFSEGQDLRRVFMAWFREQGGGEHENLMFPGSVVVVVVVAVEHAPRRRHFLNDDAPKTDNKTIYF